MIGVWTAVVYPFPFHGHGVNTGLLTALFIKAKFCFSASYGVTHKNQASLTREAPVQFSSVAQPCPTVCNPMDHSIPGLPVHRQLPKFTQTHVLWVGDAIQPSHPVVPFSSCLQSFLALFRVFSNKSVLHSRWSKDWSFSFSISPSSEHSFRVDFLQDWLVWSPCSPRDSQESSLTPQFKSLNSLAFSLLYGPKAI